MHQRLFKAGDDGGGGAGGGLQGQRDSAFTATQSWWATPDEWMPFLPMQDFSAKHAKNSSSKGQLNSEWIYEVIVSPKNANQILPRFLPYSLINFQCRNLCIFWLAFLEKRWPHKFILNLTDFYRAQWLEFIFEELQVNNFETILFYLRYLNENSIRL